MVSCLLCSSGLLLHVCGNHSYWYCDRCREFFLPTFLQRYSPLSMQSFHPPRYCRSLRKSIRRKTKPESHSIECLYRNDTLHPQIIRISNVAGHWERMVLPGQCTTFQTLSTATLEVISGPMTSMLADRIPCRALSVRSLKPTKPRMTPQPVSLLTHQPTLANGQIPSRDRLPQSQSLKK